MCVHGGKKIPGQSWQPGILKPLPLRLTQHNQLTCCEATEKSIHPKHGSVSLAFDGFWMKKYVMGETKTTFNVDHVQPGSSSSSGCPRPKYI